ncbi:hypothetical protein [Viridibacillus arvi]|uniref:Uncharacterized protein n=1 Tax=Viridibacillus arvi TaxID=263475 RepID=A0A0M0LJI0_9BACL|nr:hypothetical protein [Viridibacillus arvi]KOO51204.1 hypothetical protein AMD00_01470 [Viridibacillus arvi]
MQNNNFTPKFTIYIKLVEILLLMNEVEEASIILESLAKDQKVEYTIKQKIQLNIIMSKINKQLGKDEEAIEGLILSRKLSDYYEDTKLSVDILSEMIDLYKKLNNIENLENTEIELVKMQEEFSKRSYEWRTKRLAKKEGALKHIY